MYVFYVCRKKVRRLRDRILEALLTIHERASTLPWAKRISRQKPENVAGLRAARVKAPRLPQRVPVRLPRRVVLGIVLAVDCFGSGQKKEGRVLETVYEDQSDQNFDFWPNTQLQYAEPDNRRTGYDTPTTPIDVKTPIETATETPLGTPPMTPIQG